MSGDHITRNGLSVAALARIRDTLAPVGQVTRVRPLRGGLSSSVHLVHLENSSGGRQSVVVRRRGEYSQRHDPTAAAREFKVLAVLTDASFPAPRPLLVDVDGGPFGAPTVVMTRLAGRPLLAPRDLPSYIRQLAQTLARLHMLPIDELAFLPDQRDGLNREVSRARQTDDSLQLAVRDAIDTEWSRIRQQPEGRRVLVHGDYWPGNVVWRRGRLVGIIDWEQPSVGDGVRDVATCRGDLWVLFGQAAADAFVDEYVRSTGAPVAELRFWDLLISSWAVPEMAAWAVAYRIMGRPDLTAEVAVERIREFARVALGQRPSS